MYIAEAYFIVIVKVHVCLSVCACIQMCAYWWIEC